MYDPSIGQVLGISTLANTAGFPVANILEIVIKTSFILVAASFIITKIIKHAKKI